MLIKSIKGIATLSLSIVATVVILTGCTTSKTLKDGTYRAEFSEADSHGWTDYVVVTVSGEKIANVEYDSLDADGKKKTESADYEETMKGAGSTTWPSKFMPELSGQLEEKQNIDDIDDVAGATDSSSSFKKLTKELKSKMEKGETGTTKVSK